MQVVVGHANPDFDAYAAMVGATKLFHGAKGVYLGTQNPNVRAFHNLHQDFLDFVDLKGLDLDSIKRIIMVDTRDPGRIGELSEVVRRSDVEIIIYDHHPPAYGDLAATDDRSMEVGATTSILVHEIHTRGIPLTPLEASLLLLGIHEDTGSLTYPGATAYDAQAAAFLMEAGADLEVVNQFLSRVLDSQQRKLLDGLIESLEVWEINGQSIVVGWASTDRYVDSASVLTHYITEDMGHRVAIAIIEMPERTQVVARSRIPELDVGAVMARIGGGGHPQAASAAFRGVSCHLILKKIRQALEAEVRPPLRASDIMSSPVRVIGPDESMREAGALMMRWGHGGLPVVADSRIVGLVTRKDYDKAHRHSLDHAPVRGFMAREVLSVSPETDLLALERLLATAGIGRVPVVQDDELIGIVTRKDLLRAQHGDKYLDRKTPGVQEKRKKQFLLGIESLLPSQAGEILREIGVFAEQSNVRAHVVGGFVRDIFLGRPNLDIDVVIEGDGVGFAIAASKRFGVRVKVHRRFGTAILIMSRTLHIDITSARTEYYTRPGALPTVERSSLRQDLFRRDFSINAMAVCINPDCFGQIADPFGGLKDLERHNLRALHTLSFIEDPTRILRAARFEERYGFQLDPASEEFARRAVDIQLLKEVSGARIREEILDIIDEESPSAVFQRLLELGTLGAVFYAYADPSIVIRSLRSAERAYSEIAQWFVRTPRRRVALIASLVHGARKPIAERWLKHLRFGREYSGAAIAVAEKGSSLLKGLSNSRKMRDSRLYHLLRPIPDEALVWLWSMGDEKSRSRVQRYIQKLSRIRCAVTGDDLTAAGLTPGPLYSAILAEALDIRLDGRAVGREQELASLARLVVKHQRKAGKGEEDVCRPS